MSMSLQQAVDQLLSSGRGQALPAVDNTGWALREALATPAMEQGLAAQAPWHLDVRASIALEEQLDFNISGGWGRLIGLAAGTLFVDADLNAFVLGEQAEELLGRRDDEDLQHMLFNSFTVNLVPPAAAAALYVTVGLHPLWGLWLAKQRGSCESPLSQVDEEGLKRASAYTSGVLAGFVQALRLCDPDVRYRTEFLADVLMASTSASYCMARVDEYDGDMPLMAIGHDRNRLTASLAITDFFDYWLVPSGAARKNDHGWFSVTPSVLAGAVVGDMSIEQQREWYAAALDIEQGGH